MLNKKFDLKKLAKVAAVGVASVAMVIPLTLSGFNANTNVHADETDKIFERDEKNTTPEAKAEDKRDAEIGNAAYDEGTLHNIKVDPSEDLAEEENPYDDFMKAHKSLVDYYAKKNHVYGTFVKKHGGLYVPKKYRKMDGLDKNGHIINNHKHAAHKSYTKKSKNVIHAKSRLNHLRKARRHANRKGEKTKKNRTRKENKQSKEIKESNIQLNYALKQSKITPYRTKRAIRYNHQARNTKRGINDAINMKLTKRLRNNRQYRNGYMKVIRYWNKGGKLWNSNKGAYQNMIKYGVLALVGNA